MKRSKKRGRPEKAPKKDMSNIKKSICDFLGKIIGAEITVRAVIEHRRDGEITLEDGSKTGGYHICHSISRLGFIYRFPEHMKRLLADLKRRSFDKISPLSGLHDMTGVKGDTLSEVGFFDASGVELASVSGFEPFSGDMLSVCGNAEDDYLRIDLISEDENEISFIKKRKNKGENSWILKLKGKDVLLNREEMVRLVSAVME